MSLVMQHLDAFNTRDIEQLCAGFSNDIVFATGQDIVSGRDEVRRFFEDALDDSVQLTLHLGRAIAEDNAAACELTESITFQGVTREESIAAFYTVRDRFLTSVKVYREGLPSISSSPRIP